MIASLFSFLIHDFPLFWLFYLRINEKMHMKKGKSKAMDLPSLHKLFQMALETGWTAKLETFFRFGRRNNRQINSNSVASWVKAIFFNLKGVMPLLASQWHYIRVIISPRKRVFRWPLVFKWSDHACCSKKGYSYKHPPQALKLSLLKRVRRQLLQELECEEEKKDRMKVFYGFWVVYTVALKSVPELKILWTA
ncbi:hypothetical protein BCV71DRAFT_238407 [Rhizopus microsporus]|uniref:Uncharacterized protein n=1 Tax=Rhizopus microsporus TaxID=58291 RepID=A0A1X0RQU7_RHIZD|nr:hypothetical protein BCV71DRAFT_238407 [Rhizopus microsporus]